MKFVITFANVVTSFTKVAVTFAKEMIFFAKVVVPFANVAITFAKVVVTFGKEMNFFAKVVVEFGKVAAIFAKEVVLFGTVAEESPINFVTVRAGMAADRVNAPFVNATLVLSVCDLQPKNAAGILQRTKNGPPQFVR